VRRRLTDGDRAHISVCKKLRAKGQRAQAPTSKHISYRERWRRSKSSLPFEAWLRKEGILS
jgi:hypothetical protein